VLFLQCLEAFAVATVVTFLELVTSRYPRTVCLVTRSGSLYLYAVIYGLFGAVVNFAYPSLFPPSLPDTAHSAVGAVSTAWNSNPWVRAAIIGFTIKAFLHVRFFELSTGPGKTVPIGIETVTQLFEPLLLRNIKLDHWIALTQFLAPAVAKYPDLPRTRAQALAAIPMGFDTSERAAMAGDLDAAETVTDVLRVYLSNVGCKLFKNTFS